MRTPVEGNGALSKGGVWLQMGGGVYDVAMRWICSVIVGVVLGQGAIAFGQSATAPATGPTTSAATMEGAPRARMAKGAILKAVEAERREIETMSVEFRFDSNESGDERARYAARVV